MTTNAAPTPAAAHKAPASCLSRKYRSKRVTIRRRRHHRSCSNEPRDIAEIEALRKADAESTFATIPIAEESHALTFSPMQLPVGRRGAR
jgi:plasmid stability protein